MTTASDKPVPGSAPDSTDFELIELMFFAYRAFVREPDRILEQMDFGRAHHRVLHFVHRHPGLTIAGLLDILQITKQSLARVLKDLIKSGHIEQRAGHEDKRQRLLFTTATGRDLADRLAKAQTLRLAQALDAVKDRQTVLDFLTRLIDPKDAPVFLSEKRSPERRP